MPSNKIVLIPHGIDVKPFASLTGHNQCQDGVIDLAFLGRLEHNQKGVLYIPDILDRLDALQVPYRLRIAGSGSHRQAMESRMQQAVSEGRVSFVGTLPRRDIPAFLRQADVLLFPSHHEGFGFSLIEGMAAGCVPVASRLEGVTDFIIEDERTGILCPVGDVEAFASAIMTLYEDSARLHRMGKAAAEAAHRRFNSDRVAADYAQMLNAVVDENPVAPPPLPWSEFRVPPPYRRGWRDILPRPVRLIARRLLYKLNLSEKYG
jgi:glycosyltransferase involved in cell wall biosynthesis